MAKAGDARLGSDDMDKLYRIKEAAQILDVSIDRMRELVWSGQISYIDVNKGGKNIQARFTRAHLDEFKREREVKAG